MNKNVLALIGSFCLAFGIAVMAADVPKWAWWTSQAMVILGPILMGSRALTSFSSERPRKSNPKTKLP